MNRPNSLIAALLAASFSWGAAAESTMTRSVSTLSVPADFQGIVIEGPAEVTFQKQKVSRHPWDRSGGGIVEYFGGLNIEGKVQIHTAVCAGVDRPHVDRRRTALAPISF